MEYNVLVYKSVYVKWSVIVKTLKAKFLSTNLYPSTYEKVGEFNGESHVFATISFHKLILVNEH